LTTCLSCGKDAFKKQVTAAGFQLKGSGWYVTDFRGGKAPATGTAPATSAAAPAAAEASSSGESSTAASPAPAAKSDTSAS